MRRIRNRNFLCSSSNLSCRFYFLTLCCLPADGGGAEYMSSFTIAILHTTKSETIAQRKTATIVEGVVEKASPQLRLLSTIHFFSFLSFPFISFAYFFSPSSFCFGYATIKNYSYATSFSRLSAWSQQPANQPGQTMAANKRHSEKVTLSFWCDTPDSSRRFCVIFILLLFLFGSKVRFIAPPHQKLSFVFRSVSSLRPTSPFLRSLLAFFFFCCSWFLYFSRVRFSIWAFFFCLSALFVRNSSRFHLNGLVSLHSVSTEHRTLQQIVAANNGVLGGLVSGERFHLNKYILFTVYWWIERTIRPPTWTQLLRCNLR